MPADHLSLYIDLEDGHKADLEATSRAAIAFAEAVREIAAFTDPFSDVRLELVSTTEGSLSLNTKIKFKAAGRPHEITLYTLLVVFGTYFAGATSSFVGDKILTTTWERIFGQEEVVLSEADKNDIADRAAKTVAAKAGEQQVKKLYAELDKDPAVTGVGITREPGAKPKVIIPRTEFAHWSGAQIIEEPAEKKRTTLEDVTAVLVSPVLTNNRKRRWKFRIGDKEFGAPVRDEYFIDAVLSGKHPILMKGNIQMKIRLETQEEYIKGVWVPKEHIVWNVLGVPGQYQGPQKSLPFNDSQKADDKPHRR